MADCLFCSFVAGTPHHMVWEDDDHLAFLTPFPNTEGFTVVITKQHHPSDVLSLPGSVFTNLMQAAKVVGNLLTKSFSDVARTGLIAEGYGVDHAHVKLVPMHGTVGKTIIHSTNRAYFPQYQGYLSSNDGPKVDEETLRALAQKIRSF